MHPRSPARHRRFAVSALLAATLPFAAPVGMPLGTGEAAAATARVGSYGTATVDGVAGTGEWAAADVLTLSIPPAAAPEGAGLEPVPATLFLMNDGTNLHAAVRVPGAYARIDIALELDRDHDHKLEPLDDVLQVSVLPTDVAPRPLTLLDQFLRCTGSLGCRMDDTQSRVGQPPPGTIDGAAAGGFDAAGAYVELSHPLASADAAHDTQAAPGRVLGLAFSLKLATGVAQGCPQPTCRWTGGFDAGDLVLASAPAAYTATDEMAAALRVESASVIPAAALPGGTIRITFRVVNRSSAVLVVPSDGATGRHLAARVVEMIDNEDDPGPIGARSPDVDPSVSTSRVRDRGVDVVAGLGGTVWPAGVAITFTTSLSTAGFAPGTYRYDLALIANSGAQPLETVAVRFVLKAVATEWSARVGTGGRNGAATLRAFSTDDGSLALSLRNLPARRTYVASIVRGTCGAPTTVARVGWVITSAYGRVARTLAISRARTSAIRAAAALGPLSVRLTSGSSVRCGRLADAPLYHGQLHWDVVPLDPAPPPRGSGTPTSASSIAVLGSRLLVGGRRWATGSETITPSVVWSSTDGSSWTSTALAPGGEGVAVAADGQWAVAVGTGTAWRSSDGVMWTPASVPAGGSASGPLPSVISLPAGGFLASVLPEWGAGNCQLWSSTDGDRWVQLTTSFPGTGCATLAAGSRGIVAAGGDSDMGWIAHSADGGRTWTTSLTAAGRSSSWSVAATSRGFLAAQEADTWASTDGRSWRRVGAVPQRSGYDRTLLQAIVPFGPGYVGVGASHVSALVTRAEVLLSGDGATWRWGPWVPGWVGTAMRQAIVWGDRLVVVGEYGLEFVGESNRAVVWLARLRPELAL